MLLYKGSTMLAAAFTVWVMARADSLAKRKVIGMLNTVKPSSTISVWGLLHPAKSKGLKASEVKKWRRVGMGYSGSGGQA